MKKIGVIGIGSSLRQDDGIGIVLLEKLKKIKEKLPKNIEYIDGGTGGMNLLHILARFDVVVIIDAVNFGGHPGESRLFTSEEALSKKISTRVSTHESDILKIVQLSKKLKENPDKIFIFGVQPKDTSFGQFLSAELDDAVELLVDSLHNELVSILNKNHYLGDKTSDC